MNPILEQVSKSALRWVITLGGAWLVNKGFVDESQATEIAGVAASVFALGWSIFHHTTKVSVPKEVAKDAGIIPPK